jgi:hypothetical protein
LTKVRAEQLAKQPARHHKSLSIVHEMKSVRASFLFMRKRRFQLANDGIFVIKRRVPHVNSVADFFPPYCGTWLHGTPSPATRWLEH